jgi:lysophospholipase L1-like esterase
MKRLIKTKYAADNRIRYIGRFDFSDEQGPRFAWSGSTIRARFEGSFAKAELKTSGEAYFTVIIDGEVYRNSVRLQGQKEFELASGLSDGEHEIALVKRNEFYFGTVQFFGFDFNGGNILSPKKSPERKIEIIGDSISCGFGNEAENESVGYDTKYDNAYLSFGSVTTRALDAEATIIARSGYGMIKSFDGITVNTIPNIYSLVLPDSRTEWDYSRWIPDVIAINLGTNDFSFGSLPDKKLFTDAYKLFVRRIGSYYPRAQIICSIGPIMEGKALEAIRDCVSDVVENTYRDENSRRLYFLEYPRQSEENGYGVSKHPSVTTHKLMANRLSEKIKEITGWK